MWSLHPKEALASLGGVHHSLWVTSPAGQVLAHLLMMALGGWAIGESVKSMEISGKSAPNPPKFPADW